MYFLVYGIILVIALSWWFITYVIKRRSDLKLAKEPDWISFVEEVKVIAPKLESFEQLEQYLDEVNEKVRMFETDYSFLVAFNTTIREVKDRLEPTRSLAGN